jgi:hypothetical protein
LTVPQQRTVPDLLHAPRFADQAPAEIYATLLGRDNEYWPTCADEFWPTPGVFDLLSRA